MVHPRIVVPSYQAEHALDLLEHTPSVCNLGPAAGTGTTAPE